MKICIWLVIMLPMTLAACSQDEEVQQKLIAATELKAAMPVAEKRFPQWFNVEQSGRGQRLFIENCAECHGKQGEGAENWHQAGADGKYPAPPLNGSGHTWHHPLPALVYTVKKGGPGGAGNMPAWEDRLSDTQIADILAWIQSSWPDEIYQVWAQNDSRSRGGK